jgi:D-alanyl-D-alanine carboxypeptidase
VNSTPLPRRFALAIAVSLLTVLSVGSVVSAAPPPVDPELALKLQAKLDTWRERHRAPGVAAAVRLPDGSRWIGLSGTATTNKSSQPVYGGTPFAVGSLTKTFVAALILQLKEEGKLTLGDRLSTWLPNYPKAGKITVRMLLNHRSGVFDYFAHPKYQRKVFGRPRHRWTASEILKLRGPRYCAPGACFRYSNTNYVLLGKIVYRVTGKSVARNIRERFLEPLGLDDTFFQGQEPIGRFPAKGYWVAGKGHRGFADGTWRRPNTSAATVANAAGAMLSSVRDISDWQDALLGGDVLEPYSLMQMTKFRRESGYGLGMRTAHLADRWGIGHGGSLRGFVAVMYRLPGEDIDVVILTNLGLVSLQGLVDRLTRTTLRYLYPPEPEPETDPT